MKRNLLKNNGVQSLLASLVCIVLGLFLGYVVLLIINPAGAGEAILTVIKNFLTYNRPASQLKYLGNTLVKTAPLLMCALAILFAYKVGLFNIGAAGQYCFGVALCLYAAALSTLCAMLCAMTNLLPRFLARYARLTISALLCAALALMGFGRIVQSGYPILGALCAALLVLLVLPFHQEASMSAR